MYTWPIIINHEMLNIVCLRIKSSAQIGLISILSMFSLNVKLCSFCISKEVDIISNIISH